MIANAPRHGQPLLPLPPHELAGLRRKQHPAPIELATAARRDAALREQCCCHVDVQSPAHEHSAQARVKDVGQADPAAVVAGLA
jgi:hypothetical protein